MNLSTLIRGFPSAERYVLDAAPSNSSERQKSPTNDSPYRRNPPKRDTAVAGCFLLRLAIHYRLQIVCTGRRTAHVRLRSHWLVRLVAAHCFSRPVARLFWSTARGECFRWGVDPSGYFCLFGRDPASSSYCYVRFDSYIGFGGGFLIDRSNKHSW